MFASWWLAVAGGWQRLVAGGWQWLVAASGWWLVAGGWQWLANAACTLYNHRNLRCFKAHGKLP